MNEVEPPLHLRKANEFDKRTFAAEMYAQMTDCLLANREILFPAAAAGICLVHPNKKCHLSALGRFDDISDEKALKFNPAGIICKGSSSVGDRCGLCVLFGKSRALWLTQRIQLLELGS